MGGKNKIAHGVREGKAKARQFFFYPFPCINDLSHCFLKIPIVPDTCRSPCNGRRVHGIGIKGELHILQITDCLFASYGEANTDSRHSPGFGKGLDYQQVIVLIHKGHGADAAEIHIGLVNNHHGIRVAGHNLLNGIKAFK